MSASGHRSTKDRSVPGQALRRLVDLVSHRSGLALAVMNEAAVTLPQVLLMSHVQRRGTASLSEVAEAVQASLPSVSQMIDRLVHQGLLDRTEDPADRRRKSVALTRDADAFLRRLGAARSKEYELGLASVSPDLLAQLAAVVERVVAELEGQRAPGGAGPRLDAEEGRARR